MKNLTLCAGLIAIISLFNSTLAFSQLVLPNVVSIGDDITIDGNPGNVSLSIDILNTGTENYPGGPIGLYFSSDTLLDPSKDSLVFILSIPFIAYGDTGFVDDTIAFCDPAVSDSFPSYVLDGTAFYVLYKLDYPDLVMESNEGDNTDGFVLPLIMGCLLGINDAPANDFTVTPNPNDGRFRITFTSPLGNEAVIRLQNIITQSVISLPSAANSTQKTFDLSFLPAGIYLLEVRDHDLYYQKRIVIEN